MTATHLQTLKMEAMRASQYLDLCIHASMKTEKARREYTQALLNLLNFKSQLGIKINAVLTDEYHTGIELISLDRISEITSCTRQDLLEILPELLTHHRHGYFKLSTLHHLTY